MIKQRMSQNNDKVILYSDKSCAKPWRNSKKENKYNATPPYGRLCNTVTSLLRPVFFLRGKTDEHFLIKKKPLMRSPVNN